MIFSRAWGREEGREGGKEGAYLIVHASLDLGKAPFLLLLLLLL